jgi:hypothetical protein
VYVYYPNWLRVDPVYDGHVWTNYSGLNNARIDELNNVLNALFGSASTSQSHSCVWSSSRLVASELRLDASVDGVHAGTRVTAWKTQQLLNAYCNARMHYADSSCCRAADQLTTVQIAALSVFSALCVHYMHTHVHVYVPTSTCNIVSLNIRYNIWQ